MKHALCLRGVFFPPASLTTWYCATMCYNGMWLFGSFSLLLFPSCGDVHTGDTNTCARCIPPGARVLLLPLCHLLKVIVQPQNRNCTHFLCAAMSTEALVPFFFNPHCLSRVSQREKNPMEAYWGQVLKCKKIKNNIRKT